MSITFPYKIGSEVRVTLTGVTGIVKGWWIDEDGVKWASVKYADVNKAIHTDWMRESEIEK